MTLKTDLFASDYLRLTLWDLVRLLLGCKLQAGALNVGGPLNQNVKRSIAAAEYFTSVEYLP